MTSSQLRAANDWFWMVQPVLQLSVAAVMFQRKQHRAFPIFFSYVISQIAFFSLLFPLHRWGSYETFFYAFWICQAISLAVGFEVIHEIFRDVFRPYHALKDLGSVLFKWAAMVMLLVAGVVAAASPIGEQGPLVQSVLTVQRCIRVIQCGLILFLLVFSKYVGISRRQQSFGIALGFGSFAGMELTLVALNASGHASQAVISILNTIGYDVSIVIWFIYAFVKSPAREANTNLLRPQRWDQSLSDIQHPAAADSLIPMFEGMVDRAFSRAKPDLVSAVSTKVTKAPEPAPSRPKPAMAPLGSRQLPSKS